MGSALAQAWQARRARARGHRAPLTIGALVAAPASAMLRRHTGLTEKMHAARCACASLTWHRTAAHMRIRWQRDSGCGHLELWAKQPGLGFMLGSWAATASPAASSVRYQAKMHAQVCRHAGGCRGRGVHMVHSRRGTRSKHAATVIATPRHACASTTNHRIG